MPIPAFLVVAALLFGIGAVGFLVRRNVLVTLMSIELMFNAATLTFVAFNRFHNQQHVGQLSVFFVVAIAAAEAAVGLALVVAYFRLRKSVHTDEADLLKN